MKKLLCVALLVPSVAFAAAGKQATSEGYYGRFDLGADFTKSQKTQDMNFKANNAPVVSGGIGYKFNEFFRTDINMQYRHLKTEIKDGNIASVGENNLNKITTSALTFMLNGTVDLPNRSIFTPYATAGFGMSTIKNGKADYTKSGNFFTRKGKGKTSLAWNAGFGVNTKIQENMSLDFGYKFVNIGKLDYNVYGAKASPKLQAHELTAGVIVSF